ncbi:hypothetical protein ACWD4B_15350 [Streptomyces sp. NPDC002536]
MKNNAEPYKEMVTDRLDRPYGLAVDGTANVAYVCARDSLVKVDLKTGGLTTVAQKMGDIHTIVLDGHGSACTPDDTEGTGRLYKVALDSGSKVAFGPSEMSEPLGVAMNPQKDTLYVLTWRSNTLYKLDLEGGLVRKYPVPPGKYHSVAIDAEYAYVVRDYHTIMRVKLADGTTSDLATGFTTLFDLALDGAGSLFAPDADTGILWRVDLKNGHKEEVVSGLGHTHGMAAWGKDAFVTNEDKGELFRIRNAFSPVKPPVVTEPKEGATVYPRQLIKGTVPDADTVVVYESGKVLGPAVLTGKNWTFDLGKDWSPGKHEIEVVARKGGDESIPVGVRFDVVPEPVQAPVITEPKDREKVGPRQQVKGTVVDADKVTLTDSGKDLGPAQLAGHDWVYTPAQEWALGMHEVQAVAHKGGQASKGAVVHFTVTDPNLTVSQKFLRDWKKVWDKPQYIYSFELTINAKKDRTYKWTLGFGVEKGVTVDPDWAGSFKWATITKDGSDGTVEIQNTDPQHTIDPDKPLPIDIQLLCPGESPAYKTVKDPIAHRNE